MEIAWGMEKTWWYDENEGFAAWKVNMVCDGCCSLKRTEMWWYYWVHS